jgi:hypothetical protein
MHISFINNQIYICLFLSIYGECNYCKLTHLDLSKTDYNIIDAELFICQIENGDKQFEVILKDHSSSNQNAEESKFGIATTTMNYSFTTRMYINFCGKSNITFLKILSFTNKSPPNIS